MCLENENTQTLEELPLGYWEEKSYMLVVPKEYTEDLITGIFERVANIEGVEIKEKRFLTENEPGGIRLIYENEEYEVGFYPSNFGVQELYINRTYYFSDEELEELKNARNALTIFMEFNKDPKKSFHLQLKLAIAMVPNLIGIMDESAEKMIPLKWAIMAANSSVTPSSNDLYTVQAVSNESGEVWLHTHGLCRCGLTELEILQSDRENYNNHYNLLSTFAGYLIDKKNQFNPQGNSAYIGILQNRHPVVVTCISWTKGLKEYKNLVLGNIDDRKDGHNTKTSLIFIYKSEEDEKNGRISKVSEYNNLWGENALFFISDEETAKMKALAMERFHFVKKQFEKTQNRIIIKIGLPVDTEDRLEHIWFELIGFEGDKFKATLLQEPYDVKNMHMGDEGLYTVESVTDWTIYTSDFVVTPKNAYLLEK